MVGQSTFRSVARAALMGLGLVLVPLVAFAETRLIMAEEAGCIWCARWNEEVGPEYPITAEGKAAPLLRIDINDPVPEDITLERGLFYTPTFVLIQDGQELSRIEGYPGEDFFWGLLQRMLNEADVSYDQAG